MTKPDPYLEYFPKILLGCGLAGTLAGLLVDQDYVLLLGLVFLIVWAWRELLVWIEKFGGPVS